MVSPGLLRRPSRSWPNGPPERPGPEIMSPICIRAGTPNTTRYSLYIADKVQLLPIEPRGSPSFALGVALRLGSTETSPSRGDPPRPLRPHGVRHPGVLLDERGDDRRSRATMPMNETPAGRLSPAAATQPSLNAESRCPDTRPTSAEGYGALCREGRGRRPALCPRKEPPRPRSIRPWSADRPSNARPIDRRRR